MKILRKAYDELRIHCRAYPHIESCGYIFGNSIIKDITQGKNLDNSSVSYTIDSDSTQRSVFRKDFAGVYHSHLGKAIPSYIDETKKKYKDKLYLIYSVQQDDLRGYRWDGEKFTEEKIEVT